MRIHQVTGKRRAARWAKKTSSGTRPGTATIFQPVALVRASLKRSKLRDAVLGDAEARQPVEELIAGAALQRLGLALEETAPDRMIGRRIALDRLVHGVVGADLVAHRLGKHGILRGQLSIAASLAPDAWGILAFCGEIWRLPCGKSANLARSMP